MKVLESPYSDEMYSQVFPRRFVLELPRNLPRLWLSGTNRFKVIVGPTKPVCEARASYTAATHIPICFSVGVLDFINPT